MLLYYLSYNIGIQMSLTQRLKYIISGKPKDKKSRFTVEERKIIQRGREIPSSARIYKRDRTINSLLKRNIAKVRKINSKI